MKCAALLISMLRIAGAVSLLEDAYDTSGVTYSRGFFTTQFFSNNECSAQSAYYRKEQDLSSCQPTGDGQLPYAQKLIDLDSCHSYVLVYYMSSDCTGTRISYSAPISTNNLDLVTPLVNTCTSSPDKPGILQTCSVSAVSDTNTFGLGVAFLIEK